MDNQHQKITGYRDLTQAEIDLMNHIKAKAYELDELARKVSQHVGGQVIAARNIAERTGDDAEERRIDTAGPQRWIAIARTDFQTGLMALTRAVAQPTTF